MYDGIYFDRDAEDVLLDAYKMADKRDYTEREMKALRELILSDTRFDQEALNAGFFDE